MRRLSGIWGAVVIAIQVIAASAAAGMGDDGIVTEAESLSGSSAFVYSVDDGVVSLAGSATPSDQLRAVEIAAQVPGGDRAGSDIQGPDQFSAMTDDPDPTQKPGFGGGLTDLWITSTTMVRLLADGDTPTIDINVETVDGVVTLFGTVPTQEASDAAAEEARKVSRVRGVRNELGIVPSERLDEVRYEDTQVQQKVKAALGDQDSLSDVSVKVKNGVARLTGTVPSSHDRQAAAKLAKATSGVRSVLADLTISD